MRRHGSLVRAAIGLLASLTVVVGIGACGSANPPPASVPPAPREPRWQDAFSVPMELIAGIRPRALLDSQVYGPLLRRALELVRRRSHVVAETRAMDTVEGSEEVLFALPSIDDSADGGDFIEVMLGVRADVDPAAVVDADGRPLWSQGPAGRVRELTREVDEGGRPVQASLFELPGRTWVIAAGQMRQPTRDAFARPAAPPRGDPARIDANALAMARIDGPSFVARVPSLRPPSALSVIGIGLRTVSFELSAEGDRPVRGLFDYSSQRAAGAAETVASLAIAAVGRKRPAGFEWLGDAQLSRSSSAAGIDSVLVVSAPLPAELVRALLSGPSQARQASPANGTRRANERNPAR